MAMSARGLHTGQHIIKGHQSAYLYKFVVYNVLQCIIKSELNWLIDASCLLLGGTAAGRRKASVLLSFRPPRVRQCSTQP